jgi:hypothetical protein
VFIVVLVGIVNNSWPGVACLHIIICSLHRSQIWVCGSKQNNWTTMFDMRKLIKTLTRHLSRLSGFATILNTRFIIPVVLTFRQWFKHSCLVVDHAE